MRATVQEGCISCGLCVETCPAVFHFVDGSSHGGPVPENQETAAREAAEGCPAGVIQLED